MTGRHSTKAMENYNIVSGAILLGFSVLLYLALRPRKWSQDEPPLIPSRLPYIGHPLGMFREGGRYFRILG
jgi:hypothetical protein